MGLLDYVAAPRQAVAYMFPELGASGSNISRRRLLGGGIANGGFRTKGGVISDVFVFQFWPQQLQDNYTPNYATKNIPGGSHPIYQWTSGSGRDISFTAQFVSELREEQGVTSGRNRSFLDRLQRNTATTVLKGDPGPLGIGLVGSLLLPSSRYTVNVAAAIAALQQYLYPSYGDNGQGAASPPRKLILVLPGTKLGRNDDQDGILCILRAAPVTQEAWFPNGELRSASVALRFSEIVQFSSGSVSKIKYIGSEAYTQLANKYVTSINTANELTLG